MKDDNQQIYQVCDYSITIINLKKATTGIKKVPSCTGQCHFHWRSPGKVGTFQVVIFQNTAQGVEFTWRRLGGSSFFRYFFLGKCMFLKKTIWLNTMEMNWKWAGWLKSIVGHNGNVSIIKAWDMKLAQMLGNSNVLPRVKHHVW